MIVDDTRVFSCVRDRVTCLKRGRASAWCPALDPCNARAAQNLRFLGRAVGVRGFCGSGRVLREPTGFVVAEPPFAGLVRGSGFGSAREQRGPPATATAGRPR